MSNINKEYIKDDIKKNKNEKYDSDSSNSNRKQSKTSTKKIEYKKMTDAEIKEYLKESILVPDEDWEKLSVGANISYYKKDGNFVKSGFIKAIYTNEGNTFIKYGTKLTTYPNDKYYKEFTVNMSNITEIYKRIDQSAILEYKIIKKSILSSMAAFAEKFTIIENELKNINDKIIKLEDNHIMTVRFIKKLHNIKSIDDIKNI